MNQKRYFIQGTLLLTLMGVLTRGAGFFYKIFLSRAIGAQEIGRFQLAMPVFSFCVALCGGGIQTAISRFVAEYRAKGEYRKARKVLGSGLLLSVTLSLVAAAILRQSADWIALRFLLEPECGELLGVLAFSLPFCMVHGCIGGYFMGEKKVLPSALSQLIEQSVRICFVLLFYVLARRMGRPSSALLMAFGQMAGEAASAIYCVFCIRFAGKKGVQDRDPSRFPFSRPAVQESFHFVRQTLSVSLPLSLNRMLMCVLQVIEAALLPQMLQRSGHTSQTALSAYGTLTGMAMPMILFPTAVTGALGMLLLPVVSEAQALRREKQVSRTVNASFLGGLLLGSFFLGAFLLFGKTIGSLVFHSDLAGVYIRRLALICPCFYITATLNSVLHGLGKTASLVLFNLAGFSVRLWAILFLVPEIGIDGYLFGLLAGQLLLTVCILVSLKRSRELTADVAKSTLSVLLPTLLGTGSAYALLSFLSARIPQAAALILGGAIYCAAFLAFAFLFNATPQQKRSLVRAGRSL